MKKCKAILITRDGFKKVIEVSELRPYIDIAKMIPLNVTKVANSFDPLIDQADYQRITFYRDYWLEGSKHIIGWYTER